MSRSSTEVLAIGLGTCEIAIGRRRPAWPRRAAREPGLGEPRTVEIESDRRYTEDGLFDALSRALGDERGDAHSEGDARSPAGGYRGCRAALVLDDFWGRHAILRGDFRRMRARDLDEVVNAYFADSFGMDGQTLTIRWQTQPGGRTLFASALPSALIEGLRERGSAMGVDVASIMLALPQTLNRVRSAITARTGWLLVATETLLHAVAIVDGGWSAYDTERLFRDRSGAEDSDTVADAARQIVERSASSHGPEGDVYLCGLALDHAPFERSFGRFVALGAHMSCESPALKLMELAS